MFVSLPGFKNFAGLRALPVNKLHPKNIYHSWIKAAPTKKTPNLPLFLSIAQLIGASWPPPPCLNSTFVSAIP